MPEWIATAKHVGDLRPHGDLDKLDAVEEASPHLPVIIDKGGHILNSCASNEQI
jgi:hypothetical protein